MKYLAETMTPDEAKKAYRQLAKSMHPDVGGDEEEFKILAAEYAAILSPVANVPNYESELSDILGTAAQTANAIAQYLIEVYPRTKILVSYDYRNITLNFQGSTPLPRIVDILEVVEAFNNQARRFNLLATFQREERKAPITCFRTDTAVWVNTECAEAVEVKSEAAYSGSRYTLFVGSHYERCIDARLGRTYNMRRSSKLRLRELVGF